MIPGPIVVATFNLQRDIDAATQDVLRLEEHIKGPVDIRVGPRVQHKHGLSQWLTLDRYDVTLHYKPVSFSDPDETVFLPDSSEFVRVFRNELQSTRRTQAFSGYRRFLTDGRVKRP